MLRQSVAGRELVARRSGYRDDHSDDPHGGGRGLTNGVDGSQGIGTYFSQGPMFNSSANIGGGVYTNTSAPDFRNCFSVLYNLSAFVVTLT